MLKQSFHSFHIDFHLSVDQSLTVLTQLAYGTVTKGLGPYIFDLDLDLATKSATSLPCTPACPRIQREPKNPYQFFSQSANLLNKIVATVVSIKYSLKLTTFSRFCLAEKYLLQVHDVSRFWNGNYSRKNRASIW